LQTGKASTPALPGIGVLFISVLFLLNQTGSTLAFITGSAFRSGYWVFLFLPFLAAVITNLKSSLGFALRWFRTSSNKFQSVKSSILKSILLMRGLMLFGADIPVSDRVSALAEVSASVYPNSASKLTTKADSQYFQTPASSLISFIKFIPKELHALLLPARQHPCFGGISGVAGFVDESTSVYPNSAICKSKFGNKKRRGSEIK